MNIFQQITNWAKARLHIKPTELKGTPGVKDPAALANHVNTIIGTAVDAAAALGPGVAINALTIHGDQLKGAPGIIGEQHDAVAGVINSIVAGKLANQ